MYHHRILFYQNPISKVYRAVCSCGWTLEGEKEWVQGAAAVHDLTEDDDGKNTGSNTQASAPGA